MTASQFNVTLIMTKLTYGGEHWFRGGENGIEANRNVSDI